MGSSLYIRVQKGYCSIVFFLCFCLVLVLGWWVRSRSERKSGLSHALCLGGVASAAAWLPHWFESLPLLGLPPAPQPPAPQFSVQQHRCWGNCPTRPGSGRNHAVQVPECLVMNEKPELTGRLPLPCWFLAAGIRDVLMHRFPIPLGPQGTQVEPPPAHVPCCHLCRCRVLTSPFPIRFVTWKVGKHWSHFPKEGPRTVPAARRNIWQSVGSTFGGQCSRQPSHFAAEEPEPKVP